MKRLLFISVLCSILLISCFSSQNAQTSTTYTSDENLVTYQDFYNDLSPYGRWVNYGGYGNVWIPMEQGFSPYSSNGHWLYTQMGWAWQSGYQWGWAPFHYGRWFHDNNIGWAWTPGYEWAPAWVNWRGGSQYYGWSPMAPSGYQNFQDNDDWNFVECRYITQRNLNNYYINNYNDRRIIIQNSNQINNYNTVGQRKFNYGPSQQEVEAATNSRLHAERIEQMQRAVMTNHNDPNNGYQSQNRRYQRPFPENQNPDRQIFTPPNENRIPERRFNHDENPMGSRNINRTPQIEKPIDHQITTPVQINSQPIREFHPNKNENDQTKPKKPEHPIQ